MSVDLVYSKKGVQIQNECICINFATSPSTLILLFTWCFAIKCLSHGSFFIFFSYFLIWLKLASLTFLSSKNFSVVLLFNTFGLQPHHPPPPTSPAGRPPWVHFPHLTWVSIETTTLE